VVERFIVGEAGATAGVGVDGEQPATQDNPIASGAEVNRAAALSAPRRRINDADFTGELRFE
jgi:hypothetical protein